MSKTYLLAGASSHIAGCVADLLKKGGNRVIGLSTKENIPDYDALFTVKNYLHDLPDINEPLDGLVYFPGSINLKPFTRLGEDDFMADFSINALGAARVTQKYLPNLKQIPGSGIVYISSVAASVGMPFHASIAMAKAALEGLTKSLAAELAPAIRVNAVAPSLTDTPMANKLLNSPEKTEAAQKRNPLKKIGTAQEIASLIVFLLSEQAGWISGQIVAVDGGMNHLRTA